MLCVRARQKDDGDEWLFGYVSGGRVQMERTRDRRILFFIMLSVVALSIGSREVLGTGKLVVDWMGLIWLGDESQRLSRSLLGESADEEPVIYQVLLVFHHFLYLWAPGSPGFLKRFHRKKNPFSVAERSKHLELRKEK